jgi:NAD(P)H-flavin reductase
MLRLLKSILYFNIIKNVYSWGIDYQNKFNCTLPNFKDNYMGGKAILDDTNSILFIAKYNQQNINYFTDINQEILLQFISEKTLGIMVDVNHGSLSRMFSDVQIENNPLLDEGVNIANCNNTRMYSTKLSKTWYYKWNSSLKDDLNITFTYAQTFTPVKIKRFNLKYVNPISEITTDATPTIQTDPGQISSSYPTNKLPLDALNNNMNFGWEINNDIITIISSINIYNTPIWFGIAFTREKGLMDNADTIIGVYNNINMNIQAYVIPPESRFNGIEMLKYRKPTEYLIKSKLSAIDNVLTLEFSRLLDTNNENDVKIDINNDINIIYSIGNEFSDNFISFHDIYNTFDVNFLNGNTFKNEKTIGNNYYLTIGTSILFSIYLLCVYFIKKCNVKCFNNSVIIPYFGTLSVVNIVTICLYISWWIASLVYCFMRPKILVLLGEWISINFVLLMLPITHNSIWKIIFKLPQERLLYLHKTMTILFTLSNIIKLGATVYIYNLKFLFEPGHPLMGTLSTLCVILNSLFSIWVIRIKYYEFFYYSHRILLIFIIVFGILHKIQTLYIIAIALLLYVIDLFLRMYNTKLTTITEIKTIGFDEYNTSGCILKVKLNKNIKTYPGCYFMVCNKNISIFEWHPLSMVYNENNTLLFCIKDMGVDTWSNKMKNTQLTDTIFVQGPYGELNFDYKNKYNSILLISGGIGFTPMLSILHEINENKFKFHYIKTTFIWILKHESLVEPFKNIISNLDSNFIDIQIYITNYKNTIDDFNVPVILSKPNLTEIITNFASTDISYKKCIYCCGPVSINNEVKELSSKFNIDVSSEVFHQ